MVANEIMVANSQKWQNCRKNQQKNLENGQKFCIFVVKNHETRRRLGNLSTLYCSRLARALYSQI